MSQNAAGNLTLFNRFREFVNDESKFRRFIESCNGRARRRGELTYSQEGIWERFVAVNTEFAACDFEAILAAFNFCHLHMNPLHPVRLPIRKDFIDVSYSPEYESDMMEQPHPFSGNWVLDSTAWGDATHIDSFHCDECVEIDQRLMDKHGFEEI